MKVDPKHLPSRLPEQRHYGLRGAVLSLLALITGIGVLWIYNVYYRAQLGPEQPIPFSHRIHAGVKHISCAFCHQGALQTAHAGVPPLQTCLLCHEHIIIHYPPIEQLRQDYAQRRNIEWVRVDSLPDFVYFDHSMHIHAALDCAQCHGEVKAMDRIKLVQKLQMGFCMDCHRTEKASVDCYTCHR